MVFVAVEVEVEVVVCDCKLSTLVIYLKGVIYLDFLFDFGFVA